LAEEAVKGFVAGCFLLWHWPFQQQHGWNWSFSA